LVDTDVDAVLELPSIYFVRKLLANLSMLLPGFNNVTLRRYLLPAHQPVLYAEPVLHLSTAHATVSETR